MFANKSGKSQNRIDTLIGAETKIEGDVTFTGGLRVDGHIRGNIRSAEGAAGTLIVSEQARIEGEIQVTRLVVNGTVVGPVGASDSVELHPRSRVTGDVTYNTLEMHLGAVVEGRLMHRAATEAKSVGLKLAGQQT